MTHPDYNSAAELKQVLDANGFSMQKKFGQNFLINQQARNKLIDALDVQEGTKVWEVGPGLGAMTSGLLEKGADLTVFEIDRGFISLISQYFDEGKNRKIIDDLEKKYNFFDSSEILNICYDFYYEKFLIIEAEEYAKDNYKILMSRTLKKLVELMKEKIEKNNPNYISPESPKFLLYSAHDDTLTQMQIFLNKHFIILY